MDISGIYLCLRIQSAAKPVQKKEKTISLSFIWHNTGFLLSGNATDAAIIN
jgi:hypothetical protein